MILKLVFDSNIKTCFGAYLAGSYTAKKPVIKINLDKILQLVNDPKISDDKSRRGELFNYFLSETFAHEFLHLVQEAFKKKFNEKEIEKILAKARRKNLE